MPPLARSLARSLAGAGPGGRIRKISARIRRPAAANLRIEGWAALGLGCGAAGPSLPGRCQSSYPGPACAHRLPPPLLRYSWHRFRSRPAMMMMMMMHRAVVPPRRGRRRCPSPPTRPPAPPPPTRAAVGSEGCVRLRVRLRVR
eukprot:scaffold1630_cov298-Prasinococcus_capsulatus_cf.AAC.1